MKNRSLALLSGEGTALPKAEAKSLFLAYDAGSTFESPEPRVVLATSEADPSQVASRVAFSRRVGVLIDSPADAADIVRGRRVRFRSFNLKAGLEPVDAEERMRGVDATVDLANPEYEFTLVRGDREYLALTSPAKMRQGWSKRRPRTRAFFHPSAIFPKLSRSLVNLSRCREGGIFLDPFSGSGSLPIEAAEIGARVVASDQAARMARGSLSNMHHFGHRWLGVLRADAFHLPFRGVDAVATDVPYGRASTTRGALPLRIIEETLSSVPSVMKAGSRLVLMHPQQLEVGATSELAFEEDVHLYIHKFLTRTITVLRRR